MHAKPYTVLHSLLREGQESAYEAAHAVIPDDLYRAFVDREVREWLIYRDGVQLFHVVDVDDYAAFEASLAGNAANDAWQQEMSAYVAEFFDVTTLPSFKQLSLVWQYTSQTPPAESE
jgi:L-rhamnose mutarotase